MPTMEVDSTSSDPQLSGQIEVCVTPIRLFIRWTGEQKWLEAEWHEVLWLFRDPRPDYKKELADMRSQAFEEGFAAGVNANSLQVQRLEKIAGVLPMKKV